MVYFENNKLELFSTEQDTPQADVIGPTLVNLGLNKF